jgi:hypothetical protein
MQTTIKTIFVQPRRAQEATRPCVPTSNGDHDAVSPSGNATEQTSRLTPRKRYRRKKPIRVGDALRSEGLDERAVARQLARVVERQTEAGSDKVLAGTLMDCLRYLNDASPGKSAPSAPVSVKLVHDVPRPQRAERTKIKKAKGNEK